MAERQLTLALIFLLISSLFYFFSYPGVDNDLWGHLYFGREILQSGALSSRNLYSYTAPNYRWINHEWLAEVIFYGIFDLFGSPGLVLFKLILGGGVIWILDRSIRRRNVSFLVRTLTLIWVMAILSPGFNVRPQIFSYFLFTIFLSIFCRCEDKNQTALYWTPLLMALWVNLHGGFVIGLGAMGLFSLWTAVTKVRNRDGKGPTLAHVFVPGVISLFCLGLNPYGLDLLGFLWRDLLLDRPITEWKPIPLLDFTFLEVKLAALVVFLSLRRDSWRRWNFVLVLLAVFFAFRYQRHTPLFGIAAAPFLADGLQRITHWTMRNRRVVGWSTPSQRFFAAGFFGAALIQILWIGRIHLEHRFRLVVNPSEYPTQAVDFLQRNGVQGNMAVPFDWGEYFIWKMYPKILVSIDGRYSTAYPMEVIEDSWEWMRGGTRWRRYLERYPVEIAITKRYHPVSELLRTDPEWIYIYSDSIAFIYIKRTSGQSSLLERFRAKKLLQPGPPPIYFPG
jgi:hypothetical protein